MPLTFASSDSKQDIAPQKDYKETSSQTSPRFFNSFKKIAPLCEEYLIWQKNKFLELYNQLECELPDASLAAIDYDLLLSKCKILQKYYFDLSQQIASSINDLIALLNECSEADKRFNEDDQLNDPSNEGNWDDPHDTALLSHLQLKYKEITSIPDLHVAVLNYSKMIFEDFHKLFTSLKATILLDGDETQLPKYLKIGN